jgi:hypothetical protein
MPRAVLDTSVLIRGPTAHDSIAQAEGLGIARAMRV